MSVPHASHHRLTDMPLFAPPTPQALAADLPWYRAVAAYRTNALAVWPARAYEIDIDVRQFFGRARILLNAPAAIRHVLVDNHANYRRTPATIRILRPIIGNGLFLSAGEDWKHQRRTVAPAFAPRTIPALARHIAAAAGEAVELLRASADHPTDLLAGMQRLALEIAGRSMFSLEMGRYGPELRRLLLRYGRRLARPYLTDMLLPAWIPTPRDLARHLFRVRWMGLVEHVIAERRKAPPSAVPRDLFDLLAAARDPETGTTFSEAQLRDQVATMIVAGHETTSVTLFWSLYLLASVPVEQERIAAEVEGLDLGPDRAADALPALPRTRAVVGEALRLYPPAFTIVREAIGRDSLDGAAVDPGSLMMIAPWVLHRHRRLWRDPETFDPTRFLPGAPPVDRFAYLPFGVGPRVCVGAQFAMTEATLVVAKLVQAFRLELASLRPVLPAAVITTQPDHSPPFILRTRH